MLIVHEVVLAVTGPGARVQSRHNNYVIQSCVFSLPFYVLHSQATASRLVLESPNYYGSSTEVMSDATNAAAGPSTAANPPETPAAGGHEVIKALGHILKSQTGEPMTNEKISNLLIQNMASLVQQGKLTQAQIMQVCVT